MKFKINFFAITFCTLFFGIQMNAQNVGIHTTNPQAPFHVSSSGQVHIPGGLMLLGDKSEAHMEMDFNRLQSLIGANDTPIPLLLQDQGGNVGIGLSNPMSKLHIYGSGEQMLTVQSPSFNSTTGLQLLQASEFIGFDWQVVNEAGVFKIKDSFNNFSSPGSENLRITAAGNVGIGTTSPQTKLHVDGGPDVSDTGAGDFQVGNPNGLHLRFDDNEIISRNNNGISTLFLQRHGGNLSLARDETSRVAIGSNTPQGKLQITGGSDVNVASGGELILGSTLTDNIAMDGNEIQARSNGSESALYLQQGGGDVMLLPNENGQIGIGVSNINNMPSDEYMLVVDGKALVEEVRVELSGSWPDYVFAEAYELAPLEELEDQIDLLGHLPGIPSAKIVESEGIEIGDMQKRMMEKIEELTLYIIQLDKDLNAMKVENEKLRTAILNPKK